MHIQVISIFPEMFDIVAKQGVIARAIKRQVLSLSVINPRDFTDDKHRNVDDRPYGGGPGMVMMAAPITKAIAAAKANVAKMHSVSEAPNLEPKLAPSLVPKVVYLSPQGQRFDHHSAQMLAERGSLIMLAGRYEGVDERVITSLVDEEWSIGDYVLSGGELPAMVMIDALARLLPNSLGNNESAEQDSFVAGLLDCPHYTRPEAYQGQLVPNVLLSGDHKAIAAWRMKQSLGRTWLRRPELLNEIDLTDDQIRLLEEFKREL